jgi:peptidoglycan/LPS O-acetylase OafA/YrhL
VIGVTARMPGLDLLRIAAGLGLMVCHAAGWLLPFGLSDKLWMWIGHAGVEAFLVCAAFLAARRCFDAPAALSTIRIWMRIILRLWPLYLLLFLVNVALLPSATPRLPWFEYLILAQNLAWPHPAFFGEAWIVAAAAMTLFMVPLICRPLRGLRFIAGTAWLLGLLVVTHVLRAWLVIASDPSFDLGVRKVIIARLDLPLYGILVAWMWTRKNAEMRRWSVPLAAFGAIALAATVASYFLLPIDHRSVARVFLFTLCDIGWACLLPWACTVTTSMRIARTAAVLASSAYAGLLTHIFLLRLRDSAGIAPVASDHVSGLLMLSAYLLLAGGVAVLVSRAVDRPLLALRDRWLPLTAKHVEPVAER